MVETVKAALHGSPHHRHRRPCPMSAPHHSTLMKRDSLGKLLPGETQPVADRFWAKVHKTDTCWLWTAAITGTGYGAIGVNGKTVLAHRWAYEQVKGPIPKGMQLDHLCRVRHCVNPDHLEAVTSRENSMRGDHPWVKLSRSGYCKRGHAMTQDNIYIISGKARCRRCYLDKNRRYRMKRRLQ